MDVRRHPGVAWLLLTFTLPTKRASQRVEVWRKLQRYGTVPLGNSGYLLPNSAVNEERFQWLATAIRKYGGDASIVHVQGIDNLSTPQLIGRFAEARSREYQELIRQLDEFSALPQQKRAVGRLSRLRSRSDDTHIRDAQDRPARLHTPGMGYAAETRCRPLRVRLADSALHRFQGAVCLCAGRKSAAGIGSV